MGVSGRDFLGHLEARVWADVCGGDEHDGDEHQDGERPEGVLGGEDGMGIGGGFRAGSAAERMRRGEDGHEQGGSQGGSLFALR